MQDSIEANSRLPVESRKWVVCQIACCNSDQVYMWELKITLKVCMTEQKQDVKMSEPNSGIALRVVMSQRSIDWSGA